MHTRRTAAPACGWQRGIRDNAGNAKHPLGSLANTAQKEDRVEGEGYLLPEVPADSWPILSKKKYVCEKCARTASGAHSHLSTVNLRRDAFAA
jgi:hypothetical protein